MKRLIKTTIAAAATFIVAAAFTAPAIAADNIRIIVVSHGQANDPFWSVVKNGVVAGAKDTGVSVEYRAPETFDMVAMSQLIDAAVNQNPAGTRRFHSGRVGARSIDQEGGRRRHPRDLDEFWIGRVEVAGRSPSRRPGRGDRWKGGRREAQGNGRESRPLRQPGSRKRGARSALQGLQRRLRRQGDGSPRLERAGGGSRQGQSGAAGQQRRRHDPRARRGNGWRAVAGRGQRLRQDSARSMSRPSTSRPIS